MHKTKFIFAQLVSCLDRNHLNYLIRKYGGDKNMCDSSLVIIASAKMNDVNAMDISPYEIGSYYVFGRGHNDFRCLASSLPARLGAASRSDEHVRRSVYMRTAFDVRAYDVRCTCVRRSVYVGIAMRSVCRLAYVPLRQALLR